MILGRGYLRVLEAVKRALETGFSYGALSTPENAPEKEICIEFYRE
ncbi:hypothetical protein IT157_07540 [bacterium]|nr:hypothetical protein [bacterium]